MKDFADKLSKDKKYTLEEKIRMVED